MKQMKAPSPNFRYGFAGKLLIALPHLNDTPFGQAVVLICSHDEEHAFGLVVNKPMHGLSVAEVVEEMEITGDELSEHANVFFGGPVDMQRGAVLHSRDYERPETMQVAPGVALTASRQALEAICDDQKAPRSFMLVMGHAGWEAGQLENEVKRNDWMVIDATPSLIFGQSADTWTDAWGELGISDLTRFDGNESFTPRPH
ncbi:MAG: YqgE/AlgH family protein [Parvularcula sp.]|jgi:putative transcriptional regulator|nr:YqgE/AlgH family protein [Parvularcula sp.]